MRLSHFDVVHSEDGLGKFQGDGDGHELAVAVGTELLHIVERGSQGEFTTRQPDVLVDGKFAGKPQRTVADEAVGTVGVLVGAV